MVFLGSSGEKAQQSLSVDTLVCTRLFSWQVFAYNASQDRLDLCLGQLHVQVQPLTQEMLLQALGSALQQSNTQSAGARHTSHVTSEASFSGAILHKDTSHSRTAFSGAGRTLAGPKQQPSEERAKEEVQHRSETSEPVNASPFERVLSRTSSRFRPNELFAFSFERVVRVFVRKNSRFRWKAFAFAFGLQLFSLLSCRSVLCCWI